MLALAALAATGALGAACLGARNAAELFLTEDEEWNASLRTGDDGPCTMVSSPLT